VIASRLQKRGLVTLRSISTWLPRFPSGRYPSRACFHAQQAAELALKALLIALTDDHPRSHIGDVLIRELQAAIRQARSVFAYAEELVERLVLEGEGPP